MIDECSQSDSSAMVAIATILCLLAAPCFQAWFSYSLARVAYQDAGTEKARSILALFVFLVFFQTEYMFYTFYCFVNEFVDLSPQ
jgi:hypothetical protein